jgi:hypothetical protein
MRNWRQPHSPIVGTWQKEDFRQAEKQTSGRLRSRRTRIPRKGRATGREEPGRRRGPGRAQGSPKEARAQSRAMGKGREGKSQEGDEDQEEPREAPEKP